MGPGQDHVTFVNILGPALQKFGIGEAKHFTFRTETEYYRPNI